MKRQLLLAFTVALAFLVGPGGGLSQPPPVENNDIRSLASGGTQVGPAARSVESPSAPIKPPEPAKKADLVSELIAVLNETKSVDSFLVTLELLEDMEAQAQPAIPAIIRNAERLGVFKDHLKTDGRESEQVKKITMTLYKIRAAEPEAPTPKKDKLAAGEGQEAASPLLSKETNAVRCQLKPKEGESELRVLIDASIGEQAGNPGDEVLQEVLHDLRFQLRQSLDARFRMQDVKVTFVPITQVVSFREKRQLKLNVPLDPAEVRSQFKADFFIGVRIRDGKLEGDEDTKRAKSGREGFSLTVYDLRKTEEAIHEELVDVCDRAGKEGEETRIFVRKLMGKGAQEIANRFEVVPARRTCQ
jgi:hypothetical protein